MLIARIEPDQVSVMPRYFTGEQLLSIMGLEHLERYQEIIPHFESFLESIKQPLPVTARINTLKISVPELLQRLDRAGIRYERMRWYPLGLRLDSEKPGRYMEFHMGLIHIQEEISMLPPLVLDPKPGERVLDLCAAPGGKTAQISMQMSNRGMVVANDSSTTRIVPLRANLERLGVINAVVTSYDGRCFPHYEFDRVLVDAPCTSEGTARKYPAVLDRCSQKRSLDLQRLQISLLRRAAQLTKPGGVIVYSTCTFAPEENEEVVANVLDLVNVEDFALPGLKASPGLTSWHEKEYGDDLTRCRRFYPHQNDTGGFFVAKLRRKLSSD